MQKGSKKTLADETDQLVHQIIECGIDGIIGGFPCTDISTARMDKGTGLAGKLSGLFWEMVRTICMVRPKFVLLENVAAILNNGMGDVLGAMATSGYSSEWDCVPASAVGAPHHRARTYILAHNDFKRGERHMPGQISWQQDFSFWWPYRSPEELPQRSDFYESQLCRKTVRTKERLHAIGNGNPPCVIRELTKGLK